jgi:hypothetical protein
MLVSFKKAGISEVQTEFDRIRRQYCSPYTNYFKQQLNGADIFYFSSASTVIFLNDDYDFYRLYFVSGNLEELNQFFKVIEWKTNLVIDYITKSTDGNLECVFQANGFQFLSTYLKMRHLALPNVKVNSRLYFANEEQVDLLLSHLLKDFNPYTDHLPTRLMLLNYIRNRWVIINGEPNDIRGYIVFQVLGKHVNCNFVYNSSNNVLDWLFLQRNLYGLMNQQGIRRGFLWVESENVEVIKMYKTQGWYFDGVIDKFFVRKVV